MSDTLMKALAFDNQVRVFVITATDTIEEARRRHDTWHTATAALGRTLVATALLSANLKGEDTLSVEVKGNGPIGSIHADGSPNGYIRGFVGNPHVALELNEAGKLDVSGAVGLPGTLSVRKHIHGGEPFSGQVALISGELGEDFTYYMAVSEQTPSAIGLSVLINPDESVKAAGGFMIQMLPDATEETILAVENQLASLGRFSDLIDLGLTPEELLSKLVGEDNYKILAQNDIQFNCHCSHEYYGEQLTRIQAEDLTAMIEEDHGAEIICHYCNEKYHYSEEELVAILASKA